jgi:hypothetical protein
MDFKLALTRMLYLTTSYMFASGNKNAKFTRVSVNKQVVL